MIDAIHALQVSHPVIAFFSAILIPPVLVFLTCLFAFRIRLMRDGS